MSEDLFEARKKANESGTQEAFWRDMDDFIDLEITEIELADRIVACLQKAVAEAQPPSSSEHV